jgi:hypothetical protein
MTALAERLLAVFRREYLESGYLYSGCLAPLRLARLLRTDGLAVSVRQVERAADELIAAGVVRVRPVSAFKWELVPAERLRLVEEHGLRETWVAEHPWSYPLDPVCGEIGRLDRAA